MTRIERQPELRAKTNPKERTALSYAGPTPEIDKDLIDVLEGRPRSTNTSEPKVPDFDEVIRTTFLSAHNHDIHQPTHPDYSFENPPKKYGTVKRAGYVVIGSIASIVAGSAWALDSLLHVIGFPHGTILHPFLAMLTAPAIIWLNKAWRGYDVTGKGVLGTINDIRKSFWHGHSHAHDENIYTGTGYPMSGTTYARENLNGHYEQGFMSRLMSRFVLHVAAPLAHSIEGYVTAASNEARRIWKKPLHPALPVSVPARIMAILLGGFIAGITKGLKDGENSYKRDVAAAAQ